MKLEKKKMLKLYTNLVRTRAFDELFIRLLSKGQLLGFYHSSEGGEAPGVGACSFLRKDDFIWPHLRGHGLPHMIGKGIDVKYYLAEHLGKSTGMCGGMSSYHSCDPENGLFGFAGTIGSVFPVSVGLGLAAKKNGKGQVMVSCFGDATSNRGTFHEAALMAANWKLPIVWVCENNQLGVFVHIKDAHPVENIADLAYGYGMPGVVVNGQDVIAVAEAVSEAVERAREGKGPTFIECKCHRFGAHSIGMPDLVGCETRTPEEIAELRKEDPIKMYREKLLKKKFLTQKDIERIDLETAAEVAEAERFAVESENADPACIESLLYAK